MHQELRLHGHIDDNIEYFVTVAARDAGRCHFYECEAQRLRVFAPGNEIVLDRTGLTHWGNGGSFCEYMYGVEQPVADLLKKEVANRLILFGPRFNPTASSTFPTKPPAAFPTIRYSAKGTRAATVSFFLPDRYTEP
jgi:uncharacterized protein (TIGR04442 family)